MKHLLTFSVNLIKSMKLVWSRAHWLYDELNSCWWFVFWWEHISSHRTLGKHNKSEYFPQCWTIPWSTELNNELSVSSGVVRAPLNISAKYLLFQQSIQSLSKHLSGYWTSSCSTREIFKFSQVSWEMKSVSTSMSPTSYFGIKHNSGKTLSTYSSICELLLALPLML